MRIGIITGASSGMGREFVNVIMDEDLNLDEVWVIARREQRLKFWQRIYRKQKFRVLPLDMGDSRQMDQLKETIATEKPQIRLLIHCAGFGIMGDISEIARKDQMEMVDINCKSLVDLTSMVLPYMERGAQMIYLASGAAFLPQPGFAVYAASKAFTLSFVRALRAELKGEDIRVTAVCPGPVKTEFFKRAGGEKKLPFYKKLAMATPEKVVKKAWEDSKANKEISIYGIMMNLFYVAAKIIPHRIILYFM